MTFRQFLNEKLPGFGKFQIAGEDAEFSGRLYFDEDKRGYKLSGVLQSDVKGFDELLRAMNSSRNLSQIKGEVFGLGHVDLINPDGLLSKMSSTGLDYYEISFEEMVIQEIKRIEIPDCINSVRLSSNHISNMWFGNSGFKVNPEFSQFKRWNSRIYERQEDKVLYSCDAFSLNLLNHYFENTRFERHCLIEDKILKVDFSKAVGQNLVFELSKKIARLIQFLAGSYEPFKFFSYSNEGQFFRHYINLREDGDTRDVFKKRGLIAYKDFEPKSQLIIGEWLGLESMIPYALERYSIACQYLLKDDSEYYRSAFVDMCSCLETYYYQYIDGERESFKKIIKKLVKEVEHPKIVKCFQNDVHLKVAYTRHSFVHSINESDSRAKYILESTDIRRYATKLKALFEIVVLKRHFEFTQDEIYRRIAQPWPNTLFLNEMQ